MRDTFSQNKSMIEYVSRWYLILVNYCWIMIIMLILEGHFFVI
jgi:hypothetical protein